MHVHQLTVLAALLASAATAADLAAAQSLSWSSTVFCSHVRQQLRMLSQLE